MSGFVIQNKRNNLINLQLVLVIDDLIGTGARWVGIFVVLMHGQCASMENGERALRCGDIVITWG